MCTPILTVERGRVFIEFLNCYVLSFIAVKYIVIVICNNNGFINISFGVHLGSSAARLATRPFA